MTNDAGQGAESPPTASGPSVAKPLGFAAWFERFDPPSGHIERLMFLSDGVFAIALTLLAIEIRPPEHWDGRLEGLGREFLAGCMAYLLGFAILGAIWSQQRRILALLVRIDTTTTALVLCCLAAAGLLPAAVSFQVHYSTEPASFVIYGGVFLALIAASLALWIYAAIVARMIHPDVPDSYRYGQAAILGLNGLSLALAATGIWLSRDSEGFTTPGLVALAAALACMVGGLLARRWSVRLPKGA